MSDYKPMIYREESMRRTEYNGFSTVRQERRASFSKANTHFLLLLDPGMHLRCNAAWQKRARSLVQHDWEQ
jgi:hypothetical protein